MGGSRALAWLALGTGLAVLASTWAWWTAVRPPAEAGALPAPTEPQPAPPPPEPATATSDPGDDATATGDPGDETTAIAEPGEHPTESPQAALRQAAPVAMRPARLSDLEAPATIRPVGLRIDEQDVEASVVPVGVVPGTGELDVPEDVSTLGWYEHGSAPGDPAGTAVVAGHVDSARQGPGAFFRLAEVDPGETITVRLADGTDVAYEVAARRQYAKDDLPGGEVFTREGDPALVLITCGGAFDADRRSYTDNVVVWALPA